MMSLGRTWPAWTLERVVVDPLVVAVDPVAVDLEVPAAEVQGHPVGQVAALVELHAEDAVARADRAQVDGHVGLGAAVRLDVDVLRAGEELEGSLLGEPLDDVDVLAAAVVALAGQALGVLVGQPAALRLQDRPEHVVLAGDQLDLVVLAATLTVHRLPELGIDVGDRGPGEARAGGHGHRDPSIRRSVAAARRSWAAAARTNRAMVPRTAEAASEASRSVRGSPAAAEPGVVERGRQHVHARVRRRGGGAADRPSSRPPTRARRRGPAHRRARWQVVGRRQARPRRRRQSWHRARPTDSPT